MIEYANVDYQTFKQHCFLLMQMAFLEGTAHRGGELAMDDNIFASIEENGSLRIIVAYSEEVAVGFILTIVHPQLQDDTRLAATTEAGYVDPSYRKHFVGASLIKVAKADLEAFCPGAVWRLGLAVDGLRENKPRSLRAFGFKATHLLFEQTLEG